MSGGAPARERQLVLVVEDYQDAREMYAAYLQFSGFDVAEAGNGVEAVEKATGLLPDIILMDLALPRMDGWEATRRLKGSTDAAYSDRGADRACAGRSRRRRARAGSTRSFDRAPDACREIQRLLDQPSQSGIKAPPSTADRREASDHGQDSIQEAAKPARADREGRSARKGTPPPRRSPKPRGGSNAWCRRRSNGTAQANRLHHPLGQPGFGPESIKPAEVHTIHYRDIAAVVSNTPIVVRTRRAKTSSRTSA